MPGTRTARSTRTTADRAVSLLLKAIRQLPQREQDVVLRHLLTAGTRESEGGLPGQGQPVYRVGPWAPLQAGLEERGSQYQGAAQVVPVRLPEAQYRRLKEWCQGHNFAMAVVIRGLVDQFLDRQGAVPPAEPSPGD